MKRVLWGVVVAGCLSTPVFAESPPPVPEEDLPRGWQQIQAIDALANRFMLKGQYEEATRLYQKLLLWLPENNTPLRADIERRLADLGHPVAAPAVKVEIDLRTQKQPDALSPAALAALPSTSDDAAFQPFLNALNRKIRQHWAPPEYYQEVPVTVLMTLNRKGELMDYRLKQTSGFAPADDAALKAVIDAASFTPLPRQYPAPYLVVEFGFNQ